MPRNREVSWNPQEHPSHEGSLNAHGLAIYYGGLSNRTARGTVAHSESRPETALQALMECAPGQEPEASREELAPLRELLGAAFDDVLDDRERWIADALFCRKLSERELARELSLSRVHIRRLRDEIRLKLQDALGAHLAVQEYLSR